MNKRTGGTLALRAVTLGCLLVFAVLARSQDTKPSFAEFETGLQQYPTGYVLYAKLDDKGKQAVYTEFLKAEESKRYSAAIKKAIELSVQ